MKAIIKFFVYMGLISVILYTSGCFYNGSPNNPNAKSEGIYDDKATAVLATGTVESPNLEQSSSDNMVPNDITGATMVVLYFDNGKGSLSAERREIPKVIGIARQTVLELCRGPNNKTLLPTIPDQTQLLDINIRDGLCTVNFSQHLKSAHSGGSSAENLTVYSVVNTLTQFSTIDRVLIMVDGEKVDSLAGHIDICVPLARDDDLISSI